MVVARNPALLLLMPLLALATPACDDAEPLVLPDPVAGLLHPEIVRVGETATFDGRLSVVAEVSGDADESLPAGSQIVSYRFAIADGSPIRTVGVGLLEHSFVSAGDFGVALTIVDDRGIESSVSSKIHVKQDYTAICGLAGEATPTGVCPSGRCLGDVCGVMACAGDAVCSAVDGSMGCQDGFCSGHNSP